MAANKVLVFGPGIENGVLRKFESKFMIDLHNAGCGELIVRIRGPKGAFTPQMLNRDQRAGVITYKYEPTESGDYRVIVKWSGKSVPGSPFPVKIFNTDDELRRYSQ